uniref:Uncharacterized protein n=1 Tax=Candidatus Kentrum sp. SD TaxID=2126332 RepID=A0A451BQR9_9GAMM|nr:MAG: hypothetical protein BECKSD772D_GA0070982_11362 [Candidatus Kentron sp. SD]
MRGMNMLALYPKSDRGIDPDTCIKENTRLQKPGLSTKKLPIFQIKYQELCNFRSRIYITD